MQYALMSGNPQAGGVYCGARSRSVDGAFPQEGLERNYPEGRILAELLIHDVTAPTSCWMLGRQVLLDCGLFDEALPARQDWDLWIRVAQRYSILAAPDALVSLGEHFGERIRSNPDREIEANRRVYEKYRGLRDEYPRSVRLQARAALYRRLGRLYFHRKHRFMKALGLQAGALICWPLNFDGWAALLGMFLPARARRSLHRAWNRRFGATRLAIRSH